MIKIKAIKISLLIIGGLCFGYFITPVYASDQSQVQMSVSVQARKSTDTINDFDFSTLNESYPLKQVAGASTQNIKIIPDGHAELSWFERLVNIFKN